MSLCVSESKGFTDENSGCAEREETENSVKDGIDEGRETKKEF